MNPWLLWAPLGVLLAATLVLGLRWGVKVATLTETDVITRIAQDYAAQGQGRNMTDCAASPSPRAGVWLAIRCTPRQGETQTYLINRFGGIEAMATPQFTGPEA